VQILTANGVGNGATLADVQIETPRPPLPIIRLVLNRTSLRKFHSCGAAVMDAQ
jgi:hypothetical protein